MEKDQKIKNTIQQENKDKTKGSDSVVKTLTTLSIIITLLCICVWGMSWISKKQAQAEIEAQQAKIKAQVEENERDILTYCKLFPTMETLTCEDAFYHKYCAQMGSNGYGSSCAQWKDNAPSNSLMFLVLRDAVKTEIKEVAQGKIPSVTHITYYGLDPL